MKKFISGLLIGLLLSLPIATFASGQAIKLVVNGQDITANAQPVIIGGRTLVPARALAEKLGATVAWDAVNQTVVVTSKDYASTSKPTTQTEQPPGEAFYSFNDIGTGSPWCTKNGEIVQVFLGGKKLTYENFTDQSKSRVVEIQDYYGPKDNLGRQTPYYLKSDIDKNSLPVYTRDAIEFSNSWIESNDFYKTYKLLVTSYIENNVIVSANVTKIDPWVNSPPVIFSRQYFRRFFSP